MIKVTNMPHNVKAALARVVAARARWETVKQIDNETRAEILCDNIFVEEDSGKRITNPNADFLMSEDDFTRYCRMAYARNCEKGIDSGGWELTFWPIQKAVDDAEDAYIDAIAADIPQFTQKIIETLKANPGKRKEFFAILGL